LCSVATVAAIVATSQFVICHDKEEYFGRKEP